MFVRSNSLHPHHAARRSGPSQAYHRTCSLQPAEAGSPCTRTTVTQRTLNPILSQHSRNEENADAVHSARRPPANLVASGGATFTRSSTAQPRWDLQLGTVHTVTDQRIYNPKHGMSTRPPTACPVTTLEQRHGLCRQLRTAPLSQTRLRSRNYHWTAGSSKSAATTHPSSTYVPPRTAGEAPLGRKRPTVAVRRASRPLLHSSLADTPRTEDTTTREIHRGKRPPTATTVRRSHSVPVGCPGAASPTGAGPRTHVAPLTVAAMQQRNRNRLARVHSAVVVRRTTRSSSSIPPPTTVFQRAVTCTTVGDQRRPPTTFDAPRVFHRNEHTAPHRPIINAFGVSSSAMQRSGLHWQAKQEVAAAKGNAEKPRTSFYDPVFLHSNSLLREGTPTRLNYENFAPMPRKTTVWVRSPSPLSVQAQRMQHQPQRQLRQPPTPAGHFGSRPEPSPHATVLHGDARVAPPPGMPMIPHMDYSGGTPTPLPTPLLQEVSPYVPLDGASSHRDPPDPPVPRGSWCLHQKAFTGFLHQHTTDSLEDVLQEAVRQLTPAQYREFEDLLLVLAKSQSRQSTVTTHRLPGATTTAYGAHGSQVMAPSRHTRTISHPDIPEAASRSITSPTRNCRLSSSTTAVPATYLHISHDLDSLALLPPHGHQQALLQQAATTAADDTAAAAAPVNQPQQSLASVDPVLLVQVCQGPPPLPQSFTSHHASEAQAPRMFTEETTITSEHAGNPRESPNVPQGCDGGVDSLESSCCHHRSNPGRGSPFPLLPLDFQEPTPVHGLLDFYDVESCCMSSHSRTDEDSLDTNSSDDGLLCQARHHYLSPLQRLQCARHAVTQAARNKAAQRQSSLTHTVPTQSTLSKATTATHTFQQEHSCTAASLVAEVRLPAQQLQLLIRRVQQTVV